MHDDHHRKSRSIAKDARAVARSPVQPGSITDTSKLDTAPGVATLRANTLLNTTGSIEQMEERGAQEVAAQRERLPTEGLNRQLAEAAGIQVHEIDEQDPIWTRCTLPEGWSIQQTDHSMHLDLLDDQQRRRAGIFYKAAFYDRSAHVQFCRRYAVDCYGDDCSKPQRKAGEPYGQETHMRALVRDTATNEVLFATDWLERADPRDWTVEEQHQKGASEWLGAYYPDHHDPAAYWG